MEDTQVIMLQKFFHFRLGDLLDVNPEEIPGFIIKALKDYDESLFAGTEIDQYKQYRESVIKSTFFTEEQLTYLNQPKSTEEDDNDEENLVQQIVNMIQFKQLVYLNMQPI